MVAAYHCSHQLVYFDDGVCEGERGLTCFIYLTSNKVTQRHQDGPERGEDGHHHGPLLHLGHISDVSQHGDVEKAVATEENVSFLQPNQSGVPAVEINVEKLKNSGDDVAQEREQHQWFSPSVRERTKIETDKDLRNIHVVGVQLVVVNRLLDLSIQLLVGWSRQVPADLH